MTNYHATFCIRGEVVAMLNCKDPARRLLLDISAQPSEKHDVQGFIHRTSFSVTDTALIREIQNRVAVGDVIQATGSFWQTGYVPHRTTLIDTTFALSGYQLIQKGVSAAFRYNPYKGLCQSSAVH